MHSTSASGEPSLASMTACTNACLEQLGHGIGAERAEAQLGQAAELP